MREIDFTRRQTIAMNIGPELAEDLLALNTHNRPIRAAHVAELAHDMRLGRWRLTHQGIAFDVHGRLADGQHRLLAIQMAGVTVTTLVTTMVEADACGVIDTNAKRTATDALALSGRADMLKGGGGSVNTNAGMWKCMLGGLESGLKAKITNERMFQFNDAHRAAGTFALTEFGKHPRVRSIHVAPVMAAVARAYYSYRADLGRVQRFVSILCTGIGAEPGTAEETPLRLRGYLINVVSGRNSNAAGETYGKTAAALIAFMQNRNITKLYRPDHEPFPLPEDVPAFVGRADRMALDGGRAGARGPATHSLAASPAAGRPS